MSDAFFCRAILTMLQLPRNETPHKVGSCLTEEIPNIPIKRAPIERISESNLSDDDNASVDLSTEDLVSYLECIQFIILK